MDRQQAMHWMLGVVALGTSVALLASMAHVIDAMVWANKPFMSWTMAAVLVILNAAFVCTAVINDNQRVQRAVISGILLLTAVEIFGNFTIGWLLVSEYMPADVAQLYGVSRGVATRASAFLLAGFLPVLNFLTVYALAHSLGRSMQAPQVNPVMEEAMALLGQKG